MSQSAEPSGSARIAVLLDGDHVAPPAFQPVLDALAIYGTSPIRRIYLSEHIRNKWARQLKQFSIDAVVVPSLVGGSKDPADLALAMDAVDISLPTVAGVSVVAIVSEDTDFAIVLERVRSKGLQAISVVRNQGVNATRAQKALQNAADILVKYDSLAESREIQTKVVLDTSKMHGGMEIREHMGEFDRLDDCQMELLVGMLIQLGYVRPSQKAGHHTEDPLVPAIARFYHVNQLGRLTLRPPAMALVEAFTSLVRHGCDEWVRDPGDLVFIEPIGSTGND